MDLRAQHSNKSVSNLTLYTLAVIFVFALIETSWRITLSHASPTSDNSTNEASSNSNANGSDSSDLYIAVASKDTYNDDINYDDDQCPDDPYKTAPGLCGCGALDTDCALEPVTEIDVYVEANVIEVSWSHDGANSYNIYRSSDSMRYEFVANTISKYFVFSDAGLTGDGQYCYRVRAVNHLGQETVLAGTACAEYVF